MLGYLSADIICSEKQTVFPRAKLEGNCEVRGTDNVQGQISEHIFTPNGGYFYYPSFESFSQHVQFSKLGNILRYSSVLAGEYLVS